MNARIILNYEWRGCHNFYLFFFKKRNKLALARTEGSHNEADPLSNGAKLYGEVGRPSFRGVDRGGGGTDMADD